MSRMDPTVFIVDDDEATRTSLRWLIESVGLPAETFPTADAFLESYDPERPGCVVIDVRMPGMSGLDLQKQLNNKAVCNSIIFITGFGDVPLAVQAMKNGAIDFIEKPISDQALLDRVQEAIRTDERTRQDQVHRAELTERVARLTPREREIMQQVVAGKPSRVIADDLQLSPKTVEAHRARLMEKLQAGGIADVVRIALLTRACDDGQGVGTDGSPV